MRSAARADSCTEFRDGRSGRPPVRPADAGVCAQEGALVQRRGVAGIIAPLDVLCMEDVFFIQLSYIWPAAAKL